MIPPLAAFPNTLSREGMSPLEKVGDITPNVQDAALRLLQLSSGQDLTDALLKIGQPFHTTPLVLPCRMAQGVQHLRLHRQ